MIFFASCNRGGGRRYGRLTGEDLTNCWLMGTGRNQRNQWPSIAVEAEIEFFPYTVNGGRGIRYLRTTFCDYRNRYRNRKRRHLFHAGAGVIFGDTSSHCSAFMKEKKEKKC